ncbi:MAG: zf-HC2 domain-containing protein [Clostridiales bacterium]|nr:zf-HC2 domain-containing protein [Clostridiales bacterium]
MKCSVARQLISDFVDGELSLGEEKALRSHLDVCAECEQLLSDFQKIAREARDLPSLLPSPSTWQKIAAGLRTVQFEKAAPEERKRTWLPTLSLSPGWRYALAGLLALAIIGGLVISLKPWRREAPVQKGSFEYTLAKLEEAQRYYEKAIAALNDAVETQENGLSPELAEVFKQNIEAMDKTIQACQQMVAKDPNDLTTRAYLLTAYREKVTFLEEYMGAKRASAPTRAEITL